MKNPICVYVSTINSLTVIVNKSIGSDGDNIPRAQGQRKSRAKELTNTMGTLSPACGHTNKKITLDCSFTVVCNLLVGVVAIARAAEILFRKSLACVNCEGLTSWPAFARFCPICETSSQRISCSARKSRVGGSPRSMRLEALRLRV